jgi:predicted N-formylglutamate amidohydrolase
VLIEMRHDLMADQSGVRDWAERLVQALTAA